MDVKNKKSKHKSKLSDDLSEVKPEKKVGFTGIDESYNNNSRTESVSSLRDIHTARKRNNTKVSKKSKKKKKNLMRKAKKGEKLSLVKLMLLMLKVGKN